MYIYIYIYIYNIIYIYTSESAPPGLPPLVSSTCFASGGTSRSIQADSCNTARPSGYTNQTGFWVYALDVRSA